MMSTADEAIRDVSLIYQRWPVLVNEGQDGRQDSATAQAVLIVNALEQIENLGINRSARTCRAERPMRLENEKDRPMSMLTSSAGSARQTQRPSAKRPAAKTAAASKMLTAETKKIQDHQDRIRLRAYQIYQARKDSVGDPLADWLQAESELNGK